MSKPIQVKPGLYVLFYEQLKIIAKKHGYNLVPHGSFNRDLDLIAIPWVDDPEDSDKMIEEFSLYLTGKIVKDSNGNIQHSFLPGGRKSYIININRGNKKGEWVRYADEQYYLDISVTPLIIKK